MPRERSHLDFWHVSQQQLENYSYCTRLLHHDILDELLVGWGNAPFFPIATILLPVRNTVVVLNDEAAAADARNSHYYYYYVERS